MFKKCKANCLASKYLWIRNNNIFYFIMELDKSNNNKQLILKKSYILG